LENSRTEVGYYQYSSVLSAARNLLDLARSFFQFEKFERKYPMRPLSLIGVTPLVPSARHPLNELTKPPEGPPAAPEVADSARRLEFQMDGAAAKLRFQRAAGIAPTAVAARPAAQNLTNLTADQWRARALSAAKIDPATWRPSAGFEANRENVKKVYAYYADLYNQRPELKWAGMAKLAGGTVYGGLEQSELGKTAAKTAAATATLTPAPGAPTAAEAAKTAYGEAHFLQTQLLNMQKDIFKDLAWQHQAYVEGGLPALEAAFKRGEIKEEKIIQAWRDIASGDENRQWQGNAVLLEREQRKILRPGYEAIRNRATSFNISKFPPVSLPIDSGKLIAGAMSQMAESPIPGGRPFIEVAGKNADITVFGDRWRWIQDDMLPAYRNLTPERRTALINQPLEELAGRKFHQ
jgi:hypothetical protein